MPNRPVDFKFTSDVVALLNGLGKAELSVEDLEQAFVTASNSSADLERKINRATREAEKDVENLERAVRDLPRATDDAADAATRDFERIGDEAKETGKEAGQEFTQNLGSALASGDIGSVVQETLGGLVSGISGATGAVVGAVGGLALAAWSVLKAESEKQKRELADLFDITDLITGAIDKTALMEEAYKDLGGGDLQTGLDKVKELSETLGISIGDVTAMLTGETTPAIAGMVGHLRDSNRELNTSWITNKNISAEDRKIIDAQQIILDQHEQNKADLAKINEQTDTWQQGYEGVNAQVVDLSQKLPDVLDDAEKLAVAAADTNADGFVSSLELAQAGLDDTLTKLQEINETKFEPKVVDVKVRFDDSDWKNKVLPNITSSQSIMPFLQKYGQTP